MGELKTRQPTGKPSWPIVLLSGAEKSGKTYAAAQASSSDLIGRTLWVTVGEDQPDEYGAIDGARFEIVEHDGTFRGTLAALNGCAALPSGDKPNLIVLDSATRMWDLLCDEAQASANRRAEAKAKKYNRPAPDEDVTIAMDLWNAAKQRWAHVMDALRAHQGPSLITARLDVVAVVDDRGEPTKERVSKVKAEKSLPFDVGAIVELSESGRTAALKGVRSLRFKPTEQQAVPFPDFTVDALWRRLGLAEDTSPRSHSGVNVEAPSPHMDLVRQIAELATAVGVPKEQVATDYAEAHAGQPILNATDVGYLEQIRDDLLAKQVAA
jgi:hypothetical protein